MRKRPLARTTVWLSLIALLIVPLASSQTFRLARGQKVYVVAVTNLGDGNVLKVCPPIGSNVPLVAYPAPELIPSAEGTIQGGVPDAETKARVEKEFQKQNKYKLVASAEAADLVFFVEARRDPSLFATQKVPGRPDTLLFMIGGDDPPAYFLQQALAIVVPSGLYRENPAKVETLVRNRLWESVVGSYNDTSASPERLVKLFSNGEQAYEPVTINRSGAGSVSQDPRAPVPPARAICASTQPPLAQLPGELTSAGLSPEASGASRPAPPGQAVSAAGTRINLEVTLVTVPVLVTDRDGKNIPDLKQADFHIFEDNVEQTIDRLIPESDPFNVALLVDTSASVGSNFEEIKKAAATFVEALRPEDRVMIESFSGRVYLDAEFTGDRSKLRNALIQMRRGERTRLYDALTLTMTERLDLVSGRKTIVLFTDGVDTASGYADSAGILARMVESSAPVYVIQYDTRQSGIRNLPPGLTGRGLSAGFSDKERAYAGADQFLLDLSNASGGRLERAATIGNISEAYARIAEELRSQYTLCYYPSNPTRDGSYRRIRVVVDRPGVAVRARAGYRMSTKSIGGK